jgi:hypothetical protein
MYQSTPTNIKNMYQCLQRLLLSPRASSVTHTQFRISLCRHRTPPWLGAAAWSHHVDSPPSPPHAGRPVPPRLCPGYQPAVTDVALHRSTPKAAPDPTTHAGPPAASVMRPRAGHRWQPSSAVVSPKVIFFNLTEFRFECSFEFRLFRFEFRLFSFELI